ncbi:FtsK/SpoIIIE domain-containing protein [Rothia nasimurium]|uniref:FtsK/SpoIIIE domain-containing protein n=1 Tax=Rothia nasimurium TaxID=85336 RepID=UPI001F019337|nr:FtsK/SpoIIIE domain-containing protein [Rothia nasimurium]
MRVQQPPAGSYRTVEFDYSPGTTGVDIHRELSNVWGSDNFSWGVQGQDIRELTPGQPPWTSGAQLTVLPLAPHATVLPFPDEKALFTLRVVHGPDSHSQFPLSRGSWEIGRQASLLTIDDPALAPIEGFLEVTASGVYFSDEGSHRKLEVGEKFILGGSVLVLDQYEYRAPLFRDPVVQDIDAPAPKSKLLLVATMVLPLIVGLLIAWLTQLWLVLLMACGSSLLMGLHAFSQGRERSSVRRQITQLAREEEDAIARYRGADQVDADTGIVIGRGTRPVRIRGKQRELGSLPEVQGAPYVISVEELAPLVSGLPLSTQRLTLCQLLAQNQPVYLLVQEQEATWFLRLIDPLLAAANVCTVSLAELSSLETGFLVCSYLPPSLPPQLLPFPLANKGLHKEPAELFSQSTSWHDVVLDGISEERYCALLASWGRVTTSSLLQRVSVAATNTSQLPAYALPELPEGNQPGNLWAEEIFLYAGLACESNDDLKLGLVHHGPHFLCAGTTGSGKSQLLRSLLWSAALSYPPQRLSFVLIDFKGGAGLGPLASLPHCVSLISDLDASQLMRTMKFLRADLTHRKQVWKQLGVSSYDDYIDLCRNARTAPDFPELIICIDEFRMLVDDYPDIMSEMMKIATIGRSLGYHLILATQRPQGAISPDIRANISTVMCLRVSSAQESYNVLGSEEASHISARFPGRGLLRSADNEMVEFQAPLITGLYRQDPQGRCRVRFMLDLSDSQQSTSHQPLSDTELDATNTAIYRAYREAHQLPTYQPVPAVLASPDHTELPASAGPFTLLLGQYEIAELGLQAPLIWSAEDGPILVQGASNEWMRVLRVSLLQALSQGYAVLCLTPSEQRAREIQNWGKEYTEQFEVFTYQDFNYVQHLLACCADAPEPGQLLIIDTLETLLDTLQRHPIAEAHLQQLLTLSNQPTIQVLCTSVTGVRGKYQQFFEHTLMTRSAVENDPLRSHNRDYTLPGSGQFAVEGKVIYDSSKGEVQAGTLAWVELGAPPELPKVCTPEGVDHQVNSSYQQPRSWRPLPLFCSAGALPPSFKPHAGALACGVLRDGSVAFTPPLRGGFISISGPRGSGKTTLLNTFVHANPEYFFIVISSGAGTTSEDINQAIGRSENLRIRPILLIDDLDTLSHDIQQTILTQKDKFESVVVAYTPWPRWSSSPILAALNGTSTGIVLTPHSPADLSFYPGVSLPLDLKTHGQLPAGRGIIIDHADVVAFQAASPDKPVTGRKEPNIQE